MQPTPRGATVRTGRRVGVWTTRPGRGGEFVRRRWMCQALIAVLGITAIAHASAAHASKGALASPPSLIAFDTRYSSDVSQIYTVHPDGTDLVQLTKSRSRGSWD